MTTFPRLKSAFLAILILVAISFNVNAQNHFGIYIGAGMCKEGNSLLTFYFKPGFEADASYNINFKEHLDFRVLGGYKLRGFQDEINYVSGPDSYTNTNYHLLTLGPDAIFPLYDRKHKFYLLAGLRGNYLLAESGSSSFEMSDYLDKLQLEADAGIGWEFEPGIIIEGIVSGNCLNKGNKSEFENFKAYDIYFGVALGYIFN